MTEPTKPAAPAAPRAAGRAGRNTELPEHLKSYKGVWVFVEHDRGHVNPVSWELMGEARKLAEKVGLALNPKVAQASEWETAEGGRVYAVGVGGGIAGHGADVFIGDDLVKNIQDAMSPVKRETTWDWLISEALTRLSPTGVAIIVMTRRHATERPPSPPSQPPP